MKSDTNDVREEGIVFIKRAFRMRIDTFASSLLAVCPQ